MNLLIALLRSSSSFSLSLPGSAAQILPSPGQQGQAAASCVAIPGALAPQEAERDPGTRSRSREFNSVQDAGRPVETQRQEEEANVRKIKHMVGEELRNSTSFEAVRTIKRNSWRLAAEKIEQLQKTSARIGKLESDCQSLQAIRLPNGSKPNPAFLENPLWDTLTAPEASWSGLLLRAPLYMMNMIHLTYSEKMRILKMRTMDGHTLS